MDKPLKPRGTRKPLEERSSDWNRRRLELRLSLRDLETRSGLNRATLSRIENGRMIPTPTEAGTILAAFTARELELEGQGEQPVD